MFISEFIFSKLIEYPQYLIIFQTVKYGFSKFKNFENSLIFEIQQFHKFDRFPN